MIAVKRVVITVSSDDFNWLLKLKLQEMRFVSKFQTAHIHLFVRLLKCILKIY